MRRLTPLPRIPERDPAVLIKRIEAKQKDRQNTAVLRRELEIAVARKIRREVRETGAVQ